MLEHRALNGLLGHCLHPGNKDELFNKDQLRLCFRKMELVDIRPCFPHLDLECLFPSSLSLKLVRGRNYLKDGKHTISYSHRVNKCKRKKVDSAANSIFDKTIGNLFT